VGAGDQHHSPAKHCAAKAKEARGMSARPSTPS
jgi:hypothetical protein